MIPDIRDGVQHYPDGREVCLLNTAAGKRAYQQRIVAMWRRQYDILRRVHVCIICDEPLKLEEATFEHENGKGMGGAIQDDRTQKDGQWLNGVAHGACNGEKGSKRGYSQRRTD